MYLYMIMITFFFLILIQIFMPQPVLHSKATRRIISDLIKESTLTVQCSACSNQTPVCSAVLKASGQTHGLRVIIISPPPTPPNKLFELTPESTPSQFRV